MLRRHLVVAIRHNEQQRQIDGPAAKHRQQLDRGVIGPMGVLHHEQGRLRATAQVIEQTAEQPVTIGRDVEPEHAGGVKQRAQRPRRRQRIAPPHGHPPTARQLGEPADQCRLADARLTADEHHPTVATASIGEQRPEPPELGVALQQHRHAQYYTEEERFSHQLRTSARADGSNVPTCRSGDTGSATLQPSLIERGATLMCARKRERTAPPRSISNLVAPAVGGSGRTTSALRRRATIAAFIRSSPRLRVGRPERAGGRRVAPGIGVTRQAFAHRTVSQNARRDGPARLAPNALGLRGSSQQRL